MLGRITALCAAAALWPAAALACACCADPGARFAQVAKLGAWERDQIAALSAQGPAQLYLDDCGEACVDGIADPRPRYDVEMATGATGVTLTLDGGAAGARGEIVLPWPDRYTWFGTDTDPAAETDAPDVYVELRLKGRVRGTGAFAADGAKRAELVLSGFGNMCITTRSFDGWMLTVRDEGADYRLFGGVSGD
jgi:hypothetical protein